MKVRMQLLSDAIFGNGMSVPGGEDISILSDGHGFPYYKGGTFKGVFREALVQYLNWTVQEDGMDQDKIGQKVDGLLGESGSHALMQPDRLVFSDFQLSGYVKQQMLAEVGADSAGHREQILDALSHLRTFTRISENGIAAEGSLRSCRCVNKGLNFYSEVACSKEDEGLLSEVLSSIKWIGTMRNRGFGKVRITVIG